MTIIYFLMFYQGFTPFLKNDTISNLILTKLDNIESDMTELKTDVADLKSDMVEVKADIAELKADMVEVKADIAELKADVAELKTDMGETKINLKDVRLTLENNVWVGIKRIAEGHADLSRNLRDALKPNNEFELLTIRVGMLETEVKNLKHQIS